MAAKDFQILTAIDIFWRFVTAKDIIGESAEITPKTIKSSLMKIPLATLRFGFYFFKNRWRPLHMKAFFILGIQPETWGENPKDF